MTRLLFLPLLLCALLASPARAEPTVEHARRLFQEGQKHYELGEFVEALESFKNAYRVKEDPALLFNIGQCQWKLQQDEAALHSYRSYLRRVGETAQRPLVESRIRELEARLASRRRPPPTESLAPPPPMATPAPAAGPPPASMPAGVHRAAERPEPPQESPFYARAWFWSLVAGAIAVGVGGVLYTRRPTEAPLPGNTLPGVVTLR